MTKSYYIAPYWAIENNFRSVKKYPQDYVVGFMLGYSMEYMVC